MESTHMEPFITFLYPRVRDTSLQELPIVALRTY